MRRTLGVTALIAGGAILSACATNDDYYASACERDYQRNREMATASGALLGHQLSAEDDPCGYGFGGYNRDYRYGRDRIYWRDGYRRW